MNEEHGECGRALCWQGCAHPLHWSEREREREEERGRERGRKRVRKRGRGRKRERERERERERDVEYAQNERPRLDAPLQAQFA